MERNATRIAVVFLLAICAFGQQLSHKLTNEDVINMVSLGLSDAVVIEKIQASDGTDFDTTVRGLANLKAANVSDAIIGVMIEPHRLYVPTSPDSNNKVSGGNLPSEVGVYVFQKGRLIEVEPEVVGWQTGGVLKRMGTLGIDKGHTNGTIMRSTSSLRLASPVEFG